MTKQLRDERDLADLDEQLTPGERVALEGVKFRPPIVAAWISRRIAAALARTGVPAELAETRQNAMDAVTAALPS
ncbi:MAG: hypothetical protein M3Y87_17600 [Myxococcota bacterium]|nr:hypothetical protein [Myxococcota bacterium]